MKRKIFSILFTLVLVLSFSLVTAAPVGANTDRLVPSTYTTIQAAINAAGSGDTIIVGDGTYTQDLTVNTPNLTLKSVNGSGVTTIEGVDGFVITLNSGATNFTLGGEDGDGFTVIGDATASTVLLQTVGGPSGVEVSYNTFDTSGNPSIAIAVGAGGASSLTISNNTFDLYGLTGIYFDTGDVTNLVIDSNTFTAVSGSPKWLNWVQNAHVEGATISNNLVTDCNSCIRMVGRSNAFNNVSYTGNTIAGGYIAIGPSGSGSNLITNLAITNNSFTGPADEQVFFEILGSVPAATIDWDSLTVKWNNFAAAAGEYAIKNGIGGTTLDAENNWWDDTSGPGPVGPGTGALVTDNVDYSPWLGAPVVVPSLCCQTLVGTATHEVDAIAEADTEATLSISSETDIFIVKYQSQPFPEEPFPDASLGKFIDIYLSNPDAVAEWPIFVEVHYTDGEVRTAGIAESSLGLYYYESPDTFHRCSDTGVDTAENIIWANVTEEEAGYLVGTPFGGGGNPRIVGGTVLPVDKISILMPWIGLAVALALAGVFIARFARRKVRS